jgi:hypothetical protein
MSGGKPRAQRNLPGRQGRVFSGWDGVFTCQYVTVSCRRFTLRSGLGPTRSSGPGQLASLSGCRSSRLGGASVRAPGLLMLVTAATCLSYRRGRPPIAIEPSSGINGWFFPNGDVGRTRVVERCTLPALPPVGQPHPGQLGHEIQLAGPRVTVISRDKADIPV